MEQNQFTAECTNTDDKLSKHVRICQSADFSSLQEFSHKVLLLSHLSPTRVPLLRLIWLDVVFKLSVAPTCSCWVLRSILVTSFCQRQHVWFISSSVNHETSVCLAVRGHRASSRRNFEVTSTLESASRSMFALLKHTQIYRSQVEFGRRVVAQ